MNAHSRLINTPSVTWSDNPGLICNRNVVKLDYAFGGSRGRYLMYDICGLSWYGLDVVTILYFLKIGNRFGGTRPPVCISTFITDGRDFNCS